jgi:xanthine dehydrogenase small subunit
LIRFLLDSVEHQVGKLPADTTVLSYLRDHLDRSGTKEGCASGDCGACTVVLGQLHEGELRYRAINACITPLGNLHGHQLITVENLQQQDKLHPVQQALVDCHGSQCGFCTPGFVMSMFAHRKTHTTAQREQILESLGGNLCRCTGYRPILDAAVKMYEPAPVDQFAAAEQATTTALQHIASEHNTASLGKGQQTYYSPESLQELAQLLANQPQARLVAGGTDLCLEITQNLQTMQTLIYTGRVPELQALAETNTHIQIGAAVSFSDARPLLCRQWPQLGELLERLGSLQIRNQGTLGGNIGNASPIGDIPPVLIALNASLQLRLGEQTRQVAVADYYLGYRKTVLQPGEFIERIDIPKAAAREFFRAYKISKRLEDDISAVCGAFRLQIKEGRVIDAGIAFGGMAETPRRASHCEQALRGQPWNEATIAAAMTALETDYQPISDFRASADYRMTCARNLLQRLYLSQQHGDDTLQVNHYA